LNEVDAESSPISGDAFVCAATMPRSTKRPGPARITARVAIVGVVIVALGLTLVTARLFVWPRTDKPTRADAIVVFIGRGDAFDTGIALARRGLAPALAVSVDSPIPRWCSSFTIPNVTLHCFHPQPDTTQGESRAAARLAATYHWQKVILVAIRPQAFRARLRLGRCYGGRIELVASPIRLRQYPFRVLYEWGATLKALTVQRSC